MRPCLTPNLVLIYLPHMTPFANVRYMMGIGNIYMKVDIFQQAETKAIRKTKTFDNRNLGFLWRMSERTVERSDGK